MYPIVKWSLGLSCFYGGAKSQYDKRAPNRLDKGSFKNENKPVGKFWFMFWFTVLEVRSLLDLFSIQCVCVRTSFSEMGKKKIQQKETKGFLALIWYLQCSNISKIKCTKKYYCRSFPVVIKSADMHMLKQYMHQTKPMSCLHLSNSFKSVQFT